MRPDFAWIHKTNACHFCVNHAHKNTHNGNVTLKYVDDEDDDDDNDFMAGTQEGEDGERTCGYIVILLHMLEDAHCSFLNA